ncbi:MAG: gluconate 2-dehydrogenase subunit 3 family protein [Terriglobia bacterium]
MAGVGASAALPALGLGAGAAPAMNEPMNPPPEPASLGAALPPAPALTSPDWQPLFFDAHQNETIVALSDLIIPETDTPGAKAAQVNRFIDLLLDAQPADVRKNYLEAISWVDGYCLSRYSRPFTDLDDNEQAAVLTLLTYPSGNPKIGRGVESFKILKGSIVQAYYSSEVGALDELHYQTNPYQSSFPRCSSGN